MEDLTKNEELLLLSIWRLKEEAYGITIRKNVMETTQRKLHYGSMYNTLYKLVKKGFVVTDKSDPESKRGGRSKVLYYLTRDGKKALKESQKIHELAWDGIPDYAFDREQ
ncbi:PadR family transcriptional regulator [candidate division KSB1 bacterium]